MKKLGYMVATISVGAAAFLPFAARASGNSSVAAEYQFAGASGLARNPDFDQCKRLITAPSSQAFWNLATGRLAAISWVQLQCPGKVNSTELLAPLIEDLLLNESVGSFGGTDGPRLDFVIAVRLNPERVAAWKKNFAAAMGSAGEAAQDNGFSARVWHRGNGNSLWLVPAGEWTIAARGDDLASVRAAYEQAIRQQGRPAPAMGDSWFKIDADWTRLGQWIPVEDFPLKPARTVLQLTAEKNHLWVKGHIIYEQAPAWRWSEWRPPTSLVSEPLVSFTAGQDPQPFLRTDPLSGIAGDPFAGPFYCWAMGEMPLQDYAVWPVTQAAQKLRQEAPRLESMFNPKLAALDHSKLTWHERTSQLYWMVSSIMSPSVQATHADNTDYLLAELFPLSANIRPVPSQLWQQFEGRSDMVYYDWERTGMRLEQWRVLCELLPVLGPARPPYASGREPAFVIVDNWLGGLAPYLGTTVTEVTRRSGTDFELRRNSPFVFTGFELTWLSHWLAGAPSGPVNYNLLPMAKVSGPGLPAGHGVPSPRKPGLSPH